MTERRCPTCGHRERPGDDAATWAAGCPACGRPLTGNATVPDAPPDPPDAATLTHADAIPSHAAPTVAPGDAGPEPRSLPALRGYEVLEELGRGGMGVVYKARQAVPRRVVAVKMLLAGEVAGADRLARFRAEIAAAARLQHPNIVAIHEVGTHNGRPFFSMEYVAGGTLAERLAAGLLPPDAAAALVEPLARAVQHAHERGVVHRDLKPANILLTSPASSLLNPRSQDPRGTGDGGLATLKIADFGLAKHLDDVTTLTEGPRTQAGAVLGTPAYMAPEQAAGRVEEIGPAVDVYALGAILYECLTGRPPFKGATPYETLVQVTRDDPTPPRRLGPGVPRDLEVICLKCLAKEPGRRYASAGDLADELRRFRSGEPITARPPSAVERVGRWVRRRREVAYLAGGAVLAAGLSLAVLLAWPRPDSGPGPVNAPAALPSDLGLVPEGAFGIVTVRSADLWALPEPHELVKEIGARSDPPVTLDALGTSLRRSYGVHPRDIERVTFVFRTTGNWADTRFAVLAMTGDHSPDRLREALAVEGRYSTEALGGRTIYVTSDWGGMAVCPYDDRVVMIGEPDAVREAAGRQPAATPGGPLAAALRRAAEGHALVVGLRPGADFLSEIFLKLRLGPAQDPVGRTKVVGLVADVRPAGERWRQVSLEGWLDYAGADQAAAAIGPVGDVIRALVKAVEDKTWQMLPPGALRALLQPALAAPWRRDGNTLRAEAVLDWKSDEIVARVQQAQDGARVADSLRRIVNAMKAYHGEHGRLPPAVVTGADGQPLYSWRVLLLPYLGEGSLYRRFHLNRAWDHSSNAPLLSHIPAVFAAPRAATRSVSTPFQVLTGPGGVFDHPDGRALSDITDRLSSTWLVLETADVVPWTKPADLVVTADRFPRLEGLLPGGFHAATADGQVHFFPADLPDDARRLWFTRAGDKGVLLPPK
jgi:Protein kinase domain/Protein of unknown function (DUF1559)